MKVRESYWEYDDPKGLKMPEVHDLPPGAFSGDTGDWKFADSWGAAHDLARSPQASVEGDEGRGGVVNAQPELPFKEEEDRARRHQRAFARLWLGCRDVAKRKGYALKVSEELWKQVEREAR